MLLWSNLYTQHLLHVRPSRKRDPSSVALHVVVFLYNHKHHIPHWWNYLEKVPIARNINNLYLQSQRNTFHQMIVCLQCYLKSHIIKTETFKTQIWEAGPGLELILNLELINDNSLFIILFPSTNWFIVFQHYNNSIFTECINGIQ